MELLVDLELQCSQRCNYEGLQTKLEEQNKLHRPVLPVSADIYQEHHLLCKRSLTSFSCRKQRSFQPLTRAPAQFEANEFGDVQENLLKFEACQVGKQLQRLVCNPS